MATLKILVLVAIFFCQNVSSDRILFMIPITAVSETNLFAPIAASLAARGHEVTYVAPVPITSEVLAAHPKAKPNLRQVHVHRALVDMDFMSAEPLEYRRLSKSKMSFMASIDWSFIPKFCHSIYQKEEFMKTVNDGKYDLVFLSGFFSQCFDGIAAKHKAPIITMSSVPVLNLVVEITTGFRFPPSFVPVSLIANSDRMTFWERFGNAMITWILNHIDLLYHNEAAKIYRHYLGMPELPEARVIERNNSIIFSHSHPLLNFPRPFMPNMIEVGGLQCRPANPLPKDVEDFVSGSKDGFIFFSLGSTMTSDKIEEPLRKLFLSAFSKLKQRVVWKWNKESMPDLPPNVKTFKWLPQQDILGHKNLKFFITHGGLLSTMEALYHAAPLLGLPVFMDQDSNLATAERLGFSLNMEILELTEEKLLAGIHELLTNSSYTKAAQHASKIFRDDPDNGPLERAVYWVEYTLRHKGARHLMSPAKDLNFWEFHSLDVMGLLALIALSFVFVLWRIFKWLFLSRKSSKSVEITKGLQSKEKIKQG